MAWQVDQKVIDQVKAFKPGDPVVVIYRVRGAGKAVTAIAFPGKAKTPIYVNTTGQRVELVSGPKVEGACGQPAEAAIEDHDPDRRPGRDAGRVLVLRARRPDLRAREPDRARAGLPRPLLRVSG
jgi:hypothetical protein